MADTKLRRLPERTPVKLTIQLLPDLSEALQDYAAAFERAYGKAEAVTALIPYMLSAFLESDRAFVRTVRK